MYQIRQQQFIPTQLERCWDFFSNPVNLAKITPADMGFKVLTPLPPRVYEGLMIHYEVRPLLGINTGWVTEIKTVKEPVFFVDEQRSGPYKIWHHEHFFESVDGGVMMTDIVSYKLPLGWLGKFAHFLFVKRKLEQVFSYRHKKVAELFAN